ncbi:PLP-dependent transferase, partial [Mycobacterium tuberculosis]|nr:PLP-dependent transferase [Mycobacterium tuberculosis]
VLAARALFGSCRYIIETLLPKYGVDFTLIDGSRAENWEKAIRPNTKALFLERPTNPTPESADSAAVA